MAENKYAEQFEQFKADILAHGGIIKDEDGFRMQYIFRKGVMPPSVMSRFVTENDNPQSTPAKEKEKTPAQPKKKSQQERFEDYKTKLSSKGIVINDEEAVFKIFKQSQRGVDYNQIREFVTFPPLPEKQERKTIKLKVRTENPEATPVKNQEPTPQNNPSKPEAKPEKKKEEQPIVSAHIKEDNRSITNGKNDDENEDDKPVVIDTSWAESWLAPLQQWCDSDKDDDGKTKRSLSKISVDAKIATIAITPSAELMKSNPQDKGAEYSFKKGTDEKNIDVTMGNPDGNPLPYEYFQQLMITLKENNVSIVAFEDIKTDEFRDKLLAAALEAGMQMKGAPAKINFNSAYLKDLPAVAKLKLGIHNGDLTSSGEPVEDTKERLRKHKQELANRDNHDHDGNSQRRDDGGRPNYNNRNNNGGRPNYNNRNQDGDGNNNGGRSNYNNRNNNGGRPNYNNRNQDGNGNNNGGRSNYNNRNQDGDGNDDRTRYNKGNERS